MDFLSNLTSLALGEIPVVEPLLPSSISQSQNDSKYFNEAYHEKTTSFESSDPIKEKHTQQERNFNSYPSEQKELQDYEKIIPVQEKRIFPDEKIFSTKSKSISDETNDLTNSVKPAEQSSQSDSLSFVEENGVIPSETKAVSSKNYVLQTINNLFEGGETVLKLKNTGNKTENKVEIQSINSQSKSSKNILDNKNNKSGFYTDESNSTRASTVKINIGRIEVRAVYPEQEISSKTEQNKPQLSLNEYLRSFNEGKR